MQQHTYKSANDYCEGAKAASAGVEPDLRMLKTRYWWGNKALYAIALRFWSVPDMQDLIRTATYIAYVALAVSLLALAPKTFLVVSPLILLGAFFSGVRYFADAENGIPYLWTVLAATILVVLVGRSGRRWARSAVRAYCFVAGMRVVLCLARRRPCLSGHGRTLAFSSTSGLAMVEWWPVR